MALTKRSRLLVLLTLLVAAPLITADETATNASGKNSGSGTEKSNSIYRNINEDGVVEFSDRNYTNSKKIKLKSTNTFKAEKKKFVTPLSRNDDEHDTNSDHNDATKYTSITISSPTADQQIRSNDGLISVSIAITPALNVGAGDQVELYYDGRSQGKQQSTVFNLSKVYRGQHRVQAKIIDKTGAILEISKPIQFVIHKYSALFKKKNSPKGK